MKRIIFIIMISILALNSYASFDKGVEFYNSEKFELALKEFDSIQNKDEHVFFNIGNVYYRMEDNARALAYYLKALKLNPGFKKAQNNIKLILGDDYKSLLWYFIPFSALTVYNLFYIILFLILLIIFLKMYFNFEKRFLTILFVVIFVFYSAYAGFVYFSLGSVNQAVFVLDNTYVYSSPSEKGAKIGEFFSGNVVDVSNRGVNFSNVISSDNVSGWVENNTLIFINDIR